MMKNCSSTCSHCKSRCFGIALLVVAGIAVLAWVVILLWNGLLPDIFPGVKAVGYWQALGLLVLSKILFGSLHGGCHGHWRAHRAKWENLTPEEREQLKGRFMSHWNPCRGSDKPKDATDDVAKGSE